MINFSLLRPAERVGFQLWTSRKSQLFTFVVVVILALAGCDNSSDVEDEGGVVGTGIILRGTASENRAFASNQVQIKALTGERSVGTIAANGRYLAETVAGQGPWLLRSSLGNELYRYGIAFSEESANIHSYSDVLLRNWFARRKLDIDTAFATSDRLELLPDRAQYLDSAARFFTLLEAVLDSYGVSGEQLLVADFVADNTGNDLYLDRNPVIVDGQIISVLLTHPIRLTQSTTRSLLALDVDLAASDLEAPKAPGSVVVFGSAIDQTVLVWEPADDNVGIVTYEIYRDGVLLNSTPYPVFTDTALQIATIYSYELVAVDAAGNRSERSEPAFGSTLGEPDTQAPPAPTALATTRVTSNRIDLIWAQSEIGDVVSFNIYRGLTSESLQLLSKVTSTIVTDATVSGGITYCYQVEAVDAAGNESPASEALCVDSGEQIGEVPGGVDFVPELAGLTLPDTLTIECTLELPPTVTSQNTTLVEPCYLVQQDVVLDKFVNLTLSAGTVLKFAEGTRLQIGEGASLTANGLPESPVVLTGQQPLPGFWEGVEYNRSNHPSNLIRHTLIEYAGGGEINAGLRVVSSVGEKSRIRVQNSLFRFSSRYGVVFPSLGTVLDAFEGNVVTENRWPAGINLELLGAIAANNNFTGNYERELIDVARLPTSTDILIPDLGVPYRSGGMDLDRAQLTVAPGVEIQFLANSRIKVDGEIIAKGTADNPIKLTTWEQRSPGEWVGIILSNSSSSVLQHTSIEFAGGSAEGELDATQTGAIKLVCTSDFPSHLSIASSEIISSGSWGVFLDDVGCDLALGENVQFIANTLGDINIP